MSTDTAGEVIVDVYTSVIVVETPEGHVRVDGPTAKHQWTKYPPGVIAGSWANYCGVPRFETRFQDSVHNIMKLGFHPYADGKYGRVVGVETFLNGVPSF